MQRANKRYAMMVVSLGLAGWARADTIAVGNELPVATSTAPIVASTASVVVVPVAIIVPADSPKNRDIVAWKKLEGTVQSVDRTNRALTVQDREGKDIQVTLNDRIRIFRNGALVTYSDIELNDKVVLRYNNKKSESAAD